MKAIIMAAGKGSRISDRIGKIPKSTLPLNDGTPIIRSSVIKMIECGMQPIVCTGYKSKLIHAALEGLDVKFYHNPFYSVTNNMASLWFTRSEFDGESVLLASADLYYPKSFLECIMKNQDHICMAVDSSRIMDGDFYFDVDADGTIKQYGPQVQPANRKFEYMGLTGIPDEYISMVKGMIVDYIENEKYDKYFEDMIISLNMNQGQKINFIDVAGEFWREFDFYDDYEAILKHERGEL